MMLGGHLAVHLVQQAWCVFLIHWCSAFLPCALVGPFLAGLKHAGAVCVTSVLVVPAHAGLCVCPPDQNRGCHVSLGNTVSWFWCCVCPGASNSEDDWWQLDEELPVQDVCLCYSEVKEEGADGTCLTLLEVLVLCIVDNVKDLVEEVWIPSSKVFKASRVIDNRDPLVE
eukprot:723877-Ditylum_brightwellii.AAC.1